MSSYPFFSPFYMLSSLLILTSLNLLFTLPTNISFTLFTLYLSIQLTAFRSLGHLSFSGMSSSLFGYISPFCCFYSYVPLSNSFALSLSPFQLLTHTFYHLPCFIFSFNQLILTSTYHYLPILLVLELYFITTAYLFT